MRLWHPAPWDFSPGESARAVCHRHRRIGVAAEIRSRESSLRFVRTCASLQRVVYAQGPFARPGIAQTDRRSGKLAQHTEPKEGTLRSELAPHSCVVTSVSA